MAAEPLRAPGPEAPQPAQESRIDLKKDFGEGGLGAVEKGAEAAGMEKLNELGKNLNLQAESGAQEFGEKTKSWWDRAKGVFKKKEGTPVKGEAEVLEEIEKADAVYAEFKRKYDAVVASGDETALRGMESSLTMAYDQLAAQAVKEVEDNPAEATRWKEALKTQQEPQMTIAGAKLNDVTRRLMEVRGKLGGAAPTTRAEAVVVTEPGPAPAAQEAERAQLAADAAKLEALSAEAAPSAPEPASEAPGSEAETPPKSNEEILDEASPDERKELKRLLEGGNVNAKKRRILGMNLGMKKERVGGLAGTPGEAMFVAYVEAKNRVGKSDAHGEIIGASIDAQSAEVVTKYADGTKSVEYPDGRKQRFLANGAREQPAQAETASAAEASPASTQEAPAEEPAASEKGLPDRAELLKSAAGLPGEKMVDEFIRMRELKSDANGIIVDAAFNPRKGEIRLSYEDGSELHTYSTGKVLRSYPGGDIKEVAAVPGEGADAEGTADDEAEAEEAPQESAQERRQGLFEKQEQFRSRADTFMQGLDPNFKVVSHQTYGLNPDGEPTPSLKIVHPGIREMNAAMVLGPSVESVDAGLENALKTIYEKRVEKLGMTPEQIQNFEKIRLAAEELLKKLDPSLELSAGNTNVRMGGQTRPTYETPAFSIKHPSDELLNWSIEFELDEPGLEGRLLKALEAQYLRKKERPDEEREKMNDLQGGEVVHEVLSASAQRRSIKKDERAGVKDSDQAPTAFGEIESPTKLPVGESQILSEASAETAPSAELTAEQIAKAKANPLASESMPTIVTSLKAAGRRGDGKFSTPASFMDAMTEAGFTFPADMEPNDPKKLHDAYKKASVPKRG